MLGLGSTTKRERTHVYVNSITERDAYPAALRDWGMIITVINYPLAGNATGYQLTYSTGASLSDNTKFVEYTGGGGLNATPAIQTFTADGVQTEFALAESEAVKIWFVTFEESVFALGRKYIQRPANAPTHTVDNVSKKIVFQFAPDADTRLTIYYFTALTISDAAVKNRGAWDASTNLYPAAGSGSGTAGAITAGDYWYFSSPATNIDSSYWPVKTLAISLIDTPGQDSANWKLI